MKQNEFNYLLIPWGTLTAGMAWALGFWGLIAGAVLLLIAWLFLDLNNDLEV